MALINTIHWEPLSREEIVYKHPSREIKLGTVLTVNESQEALFFKNGALCDIFGAGRHVLSTSNLPILGKVINLASGGETTFAAELWFVNKLNKRNMYWGTGGLRINDPYFEIPIKIAARGQYGIRILDSGLFVKKLVGTFSNASTNLVDSQLRIDVVEAVKVCISQYMRDNKVNINELGVSYRDLSKTISKYLGISFEEYGVELLNFNIEAIEFDETDKNYQIVMEGIANRARLNKLGVSYVQDRQLDIAQSAVENEGTGSYMGAGMGIGMGLGVGGAVGQAVGSSIGSAINPMPQPPQVSFYVAKNGQTVGPYTLDVIKAMIAQGEIVRDTYVYKVGGSAWIFAADAVELAPLLPMLPPPPPPVK